jgi:NADH:ubiquinone oxidoreductase subunit 4 (subunit M)
VVSLIYTALTTLRQVDLKRIIAYSSITHINYATLGILTFSYYTIQGGVILILAHGFISTGLFFLIGILYDRTHTRLIDYYSGLVILIPLYTFYFFIFCLANFGLPLTFNFIGEFLILLGIVYQNFFLVLFIVISIFLSIIYTI